MPGYNDGIERVQLSRVGQELSPLSSYILADLLAVVAFSSVRGNRLMVGRAVSELQRTAS